MGEVVEIIFSNPSFPIHIVVISDFPLASELKSNAPLEGGFTKLIEFLGKIKKKQPYKKQGKMVCKTTGF